VRGAKREKKKRRNFLSRVYRNILCICPQPDEALKDLLHQAKRLLARQRHDKNKLSSLHAPEVDCIAKGRATKSTSLSARFLVVITSRGKWVVGIAEIHKHLFEGHTLKGAFKQVSRLVGWRPKNAYCEKSYQGKPKQIRETITHLASRRKSRMKPSEWLWSLRFSTNEPVIGQMKEDHRMDPNYLKRTDGDKSNAILATSSFNLRKMPRVFIWLLFKELDQLRFPLIPLGFLPWHSETAV
jgi:IS5 family transposase